MHSLRLRHLYLTCGFALACVGCGDQATPASPARGNEADSSAAGSGGGPQESCGAHQCESSAGCVAANEADPTRPCFKCQVESGVASWEPRTNEACDDGLFCTLTDSCDDSGVCVGAGSPCDASETCRQDRCEALVCEPSTSRCLDGAVYLCSDDGLSETEQERCGDDQYCDPAAIGCRDLVCIPDASHCNGSLALQCNALGSGLLPGVDCSASGQACFHGSCSSPVVRALTSARGEVNGRHARFASGGRFVTFTSYDSLVDEDDDNANDLYRYDLETNDIVLISTGTGNNDPTPVNSGDRENGISANGRYVTFREEQGTDATRHGLFVRDVDSQTTTRVSLPSTPEPAISGDGQVVAYERHVGDTESTLFVRSWLTGGITGELENIEQVGFDPPSLSFDGRYVAFGASPTVAQSDGYTRIYHLDTESGDLVAVSVDDTPAGEHRQAFEPSISNDGNFVAFIAPSAILSADVNDKWDVVLRDIAAGTTQLVSVSTAGVQSNEVSDSALVAGDGRYVVFSSRGTNLVPDDTNDTWDAFVRDTVAGTTKRVSITSDGSQAEGLGSAVGISADGRFVVYRSDAPIMPGSADLETNLYVVDVSRLP